MVDDRDAEVRWRRLFEATAESVLGASDEEISQESTREGISLEDARARLDQFVKRTLRPTVRGITLGACLRRYLRGAGVTNKKLAYELCCPPAKVDELLKCEEPVTEETLGDVVQKIASFESVRFEGLGMAVAEGLRKNAARPARKAAPKPSPPQRRGIPIVGRIAAGVPIEMIEDLQGTIDFEAYAGSFAVRVSGDSMVDARFFDGDLAIVAPEEPVRDGDIAAVALGGEATVKRVYREAGGLRLVPANREHQEKFVRSDEVQILGRVIACVRRGP